MVKKSSGFDVSKYQLQGQNRTMTAKIEDTGEEFDVTVKRSRFYSV